jgi:hypothetical protein
MEARLRPFRRGFVYRFLLAASQIFLWITKKPCGRQAYWDNAAILGEEGVSANGERSGAD